MLIFCIDTGSTWVTLAKSSTGSRSTHPFSFNDGQQSGLDVSFITYFHKHVYAPNHHHRTDHNPKEVWEASWTASGPLRWWMSNDE